MDSALEYHTRHDVLEKARTYRLVPDGMLVNPTEGAPSVIRFADITRIRLRFSPTRVQTNRFECLIHARGREVKFSNEFYRGIGDFEDQSAGYRRFVVTLCQMAATENPRIQFIAGRDAWVIRLEAAFLILMALLLGAVLWMTGGPLSWLIWVKLGLIVVFLPTLYQYFKRSRPLVFDPHGVPENVLPSVN